MTLLSPPKYRPFLLHHPVYKCQITQWSTHFNVSSRSSLFWLMRAGRRGSDERQVHSTGVYPAPSQCMLGGLCPSGSDGRAWCCPLTFIQFRAEVDLFIKLHLQYTHNSSCRDAFCKNKGDYLKDTKCSDVDLFRPWRGGGAVVYMVTKLQVFVKDDKCIDQLTDCQLVKKELLELNARCRILLRLINNGVQKTSLPSVDVYVCFLQVVLANTYATASHFCAVCWERLWCNCCYGTWSSNEGTSLNAVHGQMEGHGQVLLSSNVTSDLSSKHVSQSLDYEAERISRMFGLRCVDWVWAWAYRLDGRSVHSINATACARCKHLVAYVATVATFMCFPSYMLIIGV